MIKPRYAHNCWLESDGLKWILLINFIKMDWSLSQFYLTTYILYLKSGMQLLTWHNSEAYKYVLSDKEVHCVVFTETPVCILSHLRI